MPQERKKESATSDADIEKMLAQMHSWQDDMQNKFESLLDKAGKTPQDVENLLANPENFSEKEWNRIQKRRKELEDKVSGGSEDSEKKAKGVKKKKGLKKRKGKSLGDRKGWMKM